mgnify:CR=1 FL=1
MFSLLVHKDALEDFEEIWQSAPEDAARIATLLQEIKSSQALLDSLTEHGFGDAAVDGFNVKRWQEHWRDGKDLWRLKVWALGRHMLDYRVIYAYIPGKQRYHVLGIVHRSFGYERNHPITQRILAAYEDLH